jgi:predicted nucleotidyltransferase
VAGRAAKIKSRSKLKFWFTDEKYYITPKGHADMNEKIKDELDRIVNTLANTGIVSRILLFGSYAKGEETPNSDIDLCVLTTIKDNGRRLTEISIDFRVKLLKVQNSALDLLTYNQDDFLVRAAHPHSIQHEIMEHEVVLYG